MRIAIVKLSALGDIVHAMVVLQYIKKYNQEISIDWFVDSVYKDLLEFNPDINKVHTLKIKEAKNKKSLLSFFKIIKETRKLEPYDLVIDLQGLIKSALISRLIRSKKTFGFDKFSVREKMASIFYNQKFNFHYDLNIIERNFELIKFVFKLPNDINEIHHKKSFLFSNDKFLIQNLSEEKKNILLIPGASYSSKQYPYKKFAELTKLLDANFFLIFGNEEEEKIANRIKSISPEVTLFEKLSICSLISVVKQVDLVIGSDTGPTHFAWATNTPSIILFGPTPGYRNTFITDKNKIIESHSFVNPSKLNKNDYSIQDISVQKILEQANNILGNSE